MPERCVAMGCNNERVEGQISLFRWPTDEAQAGHWTSFVSLQRSNFMPSKWSIICSAHFVEEDFVNLSEWQEGLHARLRLRQGAVPKLRNKRHAEVLAANPKSPTKAMKKMTACREELALKLPQSTSTQTDSTLEWGVSLGVQTEKVVTAEKKVDVSIPVPSKHKGTQTKTQGRSTKGRSTACQANVRQPVSAKAVQCSLLIEDTEEHLEEENGDPDYSGPKSTNFPSYESLDSMGGDRYLVCHDNLMQLLHVCRHCARPADVEVVKKVGTLLEVEQLCTACNRSFRWRNQPVLTKMPILNLLLSAAIFLSGCGVAKAFRLFGLLGARVTCLSTYYRHQKKYLFPLVISTWKEHQQELIGEARSRGDLHLEGDGRSDSPGFCAKYGTYTLMEGKMNKILDFQVVQSNEVNGSYHCELEGLRRSVAVIGDDVISVLITDRHRSIAKWVREELPHVCHYYDVWHLARGIAKKIDAAAKAKNCAHLALWKKSIINHVYWCAASSDGNGDEVSAKWESLLPHMHNQHTFDNELFPRCLHDQLANRVWLREASEASLKMEGIMMSRCLLTDIKKMSPQQQTSSLEAFHSLMLMFVPKHTAYSNVGMQARVALAAMHYNENSTRQQAADDHGELRYLVTYPKAKKGEPAVRPIKEKSTYNYAANLMDRLIQQYADRDTRFALEHAIDDVVAAAPPPLTDNMERPDRDAIIQNYVSRFN